MKRILALVVAAVLAVAALGIGYVVASRIGTTTLTIHGVEKLTPTTHRVIGDRIVAATWGIAAAMTSGDVRVTGVGEGQLARLGPGRAVHRALLPPRPDLLGRVGEEGREQAVLEHLLRRARRAVDGGRLLELLRDAAPHDLAVGLPQLRRRRGVEHLPVVVAEEVGDPDPVEAATASLTNR